jgi:hypothetical protein
MFSVQFKQQNNRNIKQDKCQKKDLRRCLRISQKEKGILESQGGDGKKTKISEENGC